MICLFFEHKCARKTCHAPPTHPAQNFFSVYILFTFFLMAVHNLAVQSVIRRGMSTVHEKKVVNVLKRIFKGLWISGLILTVILSTGCTDLKSTDTIISEAPVFESTLETAEAEAEVETKVNDLPDLNPPENLQGTENGTSEDSEKELGLETAVETDRGAGLGPTKNPPESTPTQNRKTEVAPQESAVLIAKSENEIIGEDQEKNELLNELSNQIDDLIALLDGLDTVQESDLELNYVEE